MLQPPTVRVFFFDFYHHNLSQKLFLIYLLIYLLREFLAKFGFIVLRFDVISNITFNHLAWVWYIFSEELIVQGKVGWWWKSFKNRFSKVYIWFERAPLSAILTSIYQSLARKKIKTNLKKQTKWKNATISTQKKKTHSKCEFLAVIWIHLNANWINDCIFPCRRLFGQVWAIQFVSKIGNAFLCNNTFNYSRMLFHITWNLKQREDIQLIGFEACFFTCVCTVEKFHFKSER